MESRQFGGDGGESPKGEIPSKRKLQFDHAAMDWEDKEKTAKRNRTLDRDPATEAKREMTEAKKKCEDLLKPYDEFKKNIKNLKDSILLHHVVSEKYQKTNREIDESIKKYNEKNAELNRADRLLNAAETIWLLRHEPEFNVQQAIRQRPTQRAALDGVHSIINETDVNLREELENIQREERHLRQIKTFFGNIDNKVTDLVIKVSEGPDYENLNNVVLPAYYDFYAKAQNFEGTMEARSALTSKVMNFKDNLPNYRKEALEILSEVENLWSEEA